MGLRFLADHCVPNLVIQSLRNAGHDVIRLKDVLPADSPDSAVIRKAQEAAAILLSLNGDFADIVTYPPEKYAGIAAIQVRNHPEAIALILDRLLRYLNSHSEVRYFKGKLILAEVTRIRVRE